MAEILKGNAVVDAMSKTMQEDVQRLSKQGVVPELAVVRVGEKKEDLSYEKNIMKRAEAVGVRVRRVVLSADVTQEDYDKELDALNRDDTVHGILLFRPLPAHLDDERARQMLSPKKDVDGCTDASLAGVFSGSATGFPPCTAQAAMEILHHYGVEIAGKKAAVIGRSLVIGRPVAMMLMHENATVVNCHTRTVDVPSVTKEADILITAAGRLKSVTREYTNPDQTIIDVGINWDEAAGKITGDVDFDDVAPCVKALTPVPGGVGAVTTCVLIGHVIASAKRSVTS